MSQDTVNPNKPEGPRSAHPCYSPHTALLHRVFFLIPALFVAVALGFVWLKDRTTVLPREDAGVEEAESPFLPADEAARLRTVRAWIEGKPLSVDRGVAMLDDYIVTGHNTALCDKAVAWKEAIASASERREYRVRVKRFHLDKNAYRERFHSRLEPGGPDVYLRVYHSRLVDGKKKERIVFDSSEKPLETYSHDWSAVKDPPSFKISWARGDSLRVELREADLLRDDVIASYGVDGGLSILLFSGPKTDPAGHMIELESDFGFGK